MRSGRLVIVAAMLGTAACVGAPEPLSEAEPPGPPSPPSWPPSDWAGDLRMPEARDENSDPRVVEIRLEARLARLNLEPGLVTEVWTYDGQVPGPLIRVRKGDRLIVHFTNRLPEETTIHWHGLRIPAAMDGVPGHSQAPVAPGSTFDYDFVVPDAGMYWYHPHHHSAAQLGDGLYGAIIVEDPSEPAGLGDELPLVLSDMNIDASGHLSSHHNGGDLATLFGREGYTLLVNGKVRPTLEARVGARQRWRIVNAARSRYFQLALEGHTFVRIGGDGGLIASPVESERLLVIPGERADVLVVPRGPAGGTLPVRWVPYDRGFGTAFLRPEEDLMRVRLSADPPVTPPPLPELPRTVKPLDLAGARPVEVEFTNDSTSGQFALGINGQPFGGEQHFHARVGETQIWTLSNDIDWDHPFHLHGFFFQVLDASGVPSLPLEWKDTVNVPVKKQVKVAVKYDDRPGMWMFHCHILDHADAGMMAMLLVSP